MSRTKSGYSCDNPKCGRRLWKSASGKGRWITGQDRRVTDGKRFPRYCWPGEGCNR